MKAEKSVRTKILASKKRAVAHTHPKQTSKGTKELRKLYKSATQKAHMPI